MWLATVLADKSGADQLADAPAGHRSVVGDHGEIALSLAHELIDHALGRAHRHEAADHQARAVGNHGDRIFKRRSFSSAPSYRSCCAVLIDQGLAIALCSVCVSHNWLT